VATSRSKAPSGYLPTLDGWRAIAIILVIASHDHPYRVAGISLPWINAWGGGYGVALFFALSGLLICSRLLQEEEMRKRIDLKGFYIRRFCRIQPAALVYLAAVSALILFGVISRSYSGVLSAIFFTRNYIPAQPLISDLWYTGHFWSLSIEEHYYFFVPALLVFLPRFRPRVFMLVALFILLEGLHRVTGTLQIKGVHTDLEGDAILLGALVAVLLTRPSFRAACIRWLQPWAILPLVLVIWVRIWLKNASYNHQIFVCTLPMLIVSTMLHPAGFAGRLFETKLFKFVGRISYSLYLWQEMFFPYAEGSQPVAHANFLTALQHSWLRYPGVAVLAIASYYWVEKPLIRLGHRLATPATPGREDLAEIPPADADAVAIP